MQKLTRMKQCILSCIIHLFVASRVMVTSVTIWSDPMNDGSTQADWTGNIIPVQNNDDICPVTNSTCWSICDGNTYRIASTMLYENITLTFDVNTNISHKCIFSYSTDNSISDWTPFYETINDVLNHTQTLNKTTENNVGIGIKIETLPAAPGNNDNCCYLSNVKLEGTTISSSNNFIISALFAIQIYSEANSRCQEMYGTDLATVPSFNLNKIAVAICHDFCVSKNQTVDTCGCWIGLYRNANESVWHWQDGTSLTQYGFRANGTAVKYAAPWHTDGVSGSDPNHPISNNASVRIGAVSTWSWGDTSPSNLYYPMCNAPTPEPTFMPSTLAPTTYIPTPVSESPTAPITTQTPSSVATSTASPVTTPTPSPVTTSTPLYPFGSTTTTTKESEENVLKTSDISTTTRKPKNSHLSVIPIVFVIVLVSSVILCGFIVTFYLKYQEKRNKQLIENYQQHISGHDDCYVQLIDPQHFGTEGQSVAPLEATRTRGESVSSVSLQSYVTSTMEGDATDVVIPENPDELLQEKNTAGNFGQILNDNVVAVDLMMDDIINDMDTNS